MNYDTLPTTEILDKVIQATTANNFEAIVVENKEEALSKIKELIPAGASLMNGASTTLQEIGFVDYLKEGTHGWNNLHDAVLAETDKEKQNTLRKQSVISDFYLGSAHAITEKGEIVIASNSGSQLPHLAFTSPNIILVIGTQKVTTDISSALERVDKHIVPLEDERMKRVMGFGTLHAKTLILHKENPAIGRKVRIIFVKEKLGF